jgi:hypothetical protein
MGKCKTYLIKDASSGLVKIGRSTQIQRRLSVIKTGNPSAYLIGHINADVESDLHGQFASLRISGEWFNLGDSEIQQMKNDYGDLMAIVAEDAQNNESETIEVSPDSFLVASILAIGARESGGVSERFFLPKGENFSDCIAHYSNANWVIKKGGDAYIFHGFRELFQLAEPITPTTKTRSRCILATWPDGSRHVFSSMGAVAQTMPDWAKYQQQDSETLSRGGSVCRWRIVLERLHYYKAKPLKEWRLSRRLELKPLQKLPPIENTKGINPPPARHPMRRINTKKEKQNERNTQKAGRRSPQK